MLRSDLRDALHHSEFVELYDWLGEIEIDRSSTFALTVQNHGQIAHAFEVLDLGGVLAAGFGFSFDYGVHGGVGHSRSGADYAFINFIADDFAVVVNLHDAGEH